MLGAPDSKLSTAVVLMTCAEADAASAVKTMAMASFMADYSVFDVEDCLYEEEQADFWAVKVLSSQPCTPVSQVVLQLISRS